MDQSLSLRAPRRLPQITPAAAMAKSNAIGGAGTSAPRAAAGAACACAGEPGATTHSSIACATKPLTLPVVHFANDASHGATRVESQR